ncbi:MAG: hypothetical protein GKC04_02470 [Methanomicrobiales archaeon]|nr:hypothetical protein [Methanomicrobiales archaeon]
MDVRDVITVVGACLIVAVLALVVQPALENGTFFAEPTPPVTPTPAPTPTPTPTPVPTPAGPWRIFYTPDPHGYPVIFLPERMSVFGASDPEWHSTGVETFAFLSEVRGGITQTFTVPYPVWRVNSTLDGRNHPQSALLEWVLVDAANGDILDGGEVRHLEIVRKNIQVSQKELYFIIRVRDADRYTITLERPLKLY